MYPNLYCGHLYAVCSECRGGGDGAKEFGGVWVPAVCAVHVQCVRLWVGKQLTRVYSGGVRGTGADSVLGVWEEVEGEESVCCGGRLRAGGGLGLGCFGC